MSPLARFTRIRSYRLFGFRRPLFLSSSLSFSLPPVRFRFRPGYTATGRCSWHCAGASCRLNHSSHFPFTQFCFFGNSFFSSCSAAVVPLPPVVKSLFRWFDCPSGNFRTRTWSAHVIRAWGRRCFCPFLLGFQPKRVERDLFFIYTVCGVNFSILLERYL